MRSKITTLLTVIGAVTVLVLAANTAAIAATGKGFLLGKANRASKVTGLTRTTPGPALSLRTKRTGDAPFTVNGRGKVAHLNADQVDGKDAGALGTRAWVWSYDGQLPPSSSRAFTLPTLPKGTYLFSYEAWLPTSAYDGAGDLDCYLGHGWGYGGEASGPGSTVFGTSVTGTAVVTLPAAAVVSLYCRVSTGTTDWDFRANQPLRISVVPISELTVKGDPLARVLPRSK